MIMKPILGSLSAAALVAWLLSPAAAEAPPLRAMIRPSVVRITPGAQQRFYVSWMPARLEGATIVHNDKWSVNDVSGGSEEFGTIDANGVYRAPSKTPAPCEIRIGAEVEGAGNRFVWATVI